MRHAKLVRDLIPEIVERAGKRAAYRILADEDFRAALRAKLVEEAGEVAAAGEAERLAEFADLAEVLDAALAAHGFSLEELQRERALRRAQRGGFERKIFLESVDG